jgi:hypothetical protein
MAGKKQILLTAEDVKGWLRERQDLQRKIAAYQKKLEDVNKKLAAAELLSPGSIDRKIEDCIDGASMNASSEAQPSEAKAEIDSSLAEVLYADLLKSGASLEVGQIKDRLVHLGFGLKLEQHSANYLNGLVFRLTAAERLAKNGNSYRAIPPASSKEEAGAKAPVLVVSN